MNHTVAQFYDQLSSDYHLIFADWQQAVLQQGKVLDTLIRAQLRPPPLALLDCSCGIGTQAIGLAACGYRVHATDLSPAAVERARTEAERFGVPLTVGVADIRTLATQIEGVFAAVISCDNSLPHLLHDEDLLLAARNLWSKLQANGLLLVSIRDYDQIVGEKPRAEMPRMLDGPGGKRVVFQVWDWAENSPIYTVHHFIVKEIQEGWQTVHRATQYRALLRDELSQILREAGFSDMRWHMPEESGYYQPLVTARKK